MNQHRFLPQTPTMQSLSQVLRPKVFLVIAFHWSVAITLVFVNKQLVSTQAGGQDLAVFIAWAQCVFSVLTIVMATVVNGCLKPHTRWFRVPFASFLHSDVLAMTFTFIGVIVMNNLLLKHIGVAFYQIARSSTLIFTIILSRVLLGVHITLPVVISCFLIIVGFVISVDQEMVLTSLSAVSITYGVLASMAAALGGIFTKRAIRHADSNSLGIALCNNANSTLLLFPLMISTGQLQYAVHSDIVQNTSFWIKLVSTGVLSLCLGWASIKVISVTSPLTHNMSINAKSLLQTFIAVVIEGETKTVAWWLGNIIVMLGIMNYGLSKDPSTDIQHVERIVNSSESGTYDVEENFKKKPLF